MKTLFISRSNEHGGGASKAAALLARELFHRGHDLTYWMLEGVPSAPWQIAAGNGALARATSLLHRVSRRATGVPWLPLERFLLPRGSWDIVHFHDTWLTVSPTTLRAIARRHSTVITFQDCSAFTGGCMYPWNCDHLHVCGNCPQQHYENFAVDATRVNLRAKRDLLRNVDIRVIAPSAWIASRAQICDTFRRPGIVIPNACDATIYRAERRENARARWELHDDLPTVFVSAASLADKRKNIAGALAALRRLDAPLQLILAGHPAELSLDPKWIVRSVGYLRKPADMADALSASDLFVFSSLQDNCPLAVIESLACGTPVIAYADSGGTPELIRRGEDGLLAGFDDTDDLANQIRIFLAQRSAWSARRLAIASHAAARYNVSRCADEHLALYSEPVGAKR